MTLKEIPMSLFDNVSLFQGLSPLILQKIEQRGIKRTYPKKSIPFVEGQGSDGIYIILSGLIKVMKLHDDGREKTLAILGPGEILGEMTLTEETLRSATAEALELTTVLAISREDFLGLLAEMPELSYRIINLLSTRLRQTNQQIEELIFLNARSRVINNLLNLVHKQGMHKNGSFYLPIKLTHSELAKLIGVSRETVTKVFAELQDNNLIYLDGKEIHITNLEALQKEII
ncbi:MAG: Crp/Fnr family transcriptional regulator [Firmicutes bacterium HGW-Firmicutes-12]|jgi:CRP-like cAMP-binding protein|nr:MAG: Crp/Fnr family transcriptional regulator [Firmicutes bacterium HGW-Firmicutes-12]